MGPSRLGRCPNEPGIGTRSGLKSPGQAHPPRNGPRELSEMLACVVPLCWPSRRPSPCSSRSRSARRPEPLRRRTTHRSSPTSTSSPTPTRDPTATDKPGHVTGTVTTDAPFVLVQLRDEGGSHVPDPHYIDNPSGEIQFDLEAWGYTSDAPPAYPLQVVAAACSTARSADCSPPVDSATFQVHDVVPAVTFPTDGTLVAGQDYALSVADPQGGGSLRAIWVPDSAEGDVTEQDVDREDPDDPDRAGPGHGRAADPAVPRDVRRRPLPLPRPGTHEEPRARQHRLLLGVHHLGHPGRSLHDPGHARHAGLRRRHLRPRLEAA